MGWGCQPGKGDPGPRAGSLMTTISYKSQQTCLGHFSYLRDRVSRAQLDQGHPASPGWTGTDSHAPTEIWIASRLAGTPTYLLSAQGKKKKKKSIHSEAAWVLGRTMLGQGKGAPHLLCPAAGREQNLGKLPMEPIHRL